MLPVIVRKESSRPVSDSRGLGPCLCHSRLNGGYEWEDPGRAVRRSGALHPAGVPGGLAGVAGQGAAPAVSPGLIRDFHGQVGRELGEHLDAVPGQLRTDERAVGPYRCPRAEDVPALLDLLCDWLREEFAQCDGPGAFTSAVVQAIVAHVYIEWIHPFGDDNGRTGRLLEFYLLLRAGNPAVMHWSASAGGCGPDCPRRRDGNREASLSSLAFGRDEVEGVGHVPPGSAVGGASIRRATIPAWSATRGRVPSSAAC